MVELWRWEHGGLEGDLPRANDMRPVNIQAATQKMAQAIDRGKVAPFNAALVLAWLGKNLKAPTEVPA